MAQLRPSVCVIAPISLDHQDFLGDTVELIAAEKAAELEEDGEQPKKGKKRKNSEEADSGDQSKQKKVVVAKYKIQAEHKAAMKKDKLNVKLWKEIQDKEMKTRKDLVDAVEQTFSCGICFGVVTIPVTLQCLHNFCQVHYLLQLKGFRDPHHIFVHISGLHQARHQGRGRHVS